MQNPSFPSRKEGFHYAIFNLENEDGLDDFAGVGVFECLLDIVESIVLAHQIDGQTAFLVELNQLGNEGLGVCTAFDSASEGSVLVHKVVCVNRNLSIAGNTNENAETLAAENLKHLLNENGYTDSLKAIVYTETVGDLHDGCGNVASLAVEDVSCAHFLSQLKTSVDQVNNDDLAAACDLSSHNSRQTNCACAKDSDRGAGFGLHAAENCACAGLNAAAEGAESLQVNFGVNLNSVSCFNDAVVSEGALTEEGGNGFAVSVGDSGGTVGIVAAEEELLHILTCIGLAVCAGRAGAAGGEAENDVVAYCKAAYAVADLFDDADTLMAHDHGKSCGNELLDGGSIGMANAACYYLNENFAGLRSGKLKSLDLDFARFTGDCCFNFQF